MDQKQSDERPGAGSSTIPVMLVVNAFLLKSASWIVEVITDGDPNPAGSVGPAGRLANGLIDLLSGPMLDTLCILMVAVAGVLFMSGTGEGDRTDGLVTEPPPPPYSSTLPLNDAARAAEARLAELTAQFRSIPEHIVLQEAGIEFERIEVRHVPDLQLAHREARTTVSATSAKADQLDADYAVMLNRLNDSLERLIGSCEALGRERLEVQGRFIEARHPNDMA